jgi:hypothetical protein
MTVVPLVPAYYPWLWDSYSPPPPLTDCHAQHAVLNLANVVCCPTVVYWWCHPVSPDTHCCHGLMICFCSAGCSGAGGHTQMPEVLFIQRNRNQTGDWGFSWVWHNCVHYLHYLLDHYKPINTEINTEYGTKHKYTSLYFSSNPGAL